MKNFMAVFALTARSTLFKCMGIMAAAAAAETGVFLYQLRSAGNTMRIETMLKNPLYTAIVFVAELAVLWVIATVYRGSGKNKPGYTLLRLSTGERAVTAATALSNFCMLVIGATAQILLFWGFCRIFILQTDSSDTAYMTFLAFTRNPLMESFLPVTSPLALLCNILMLAAISLTAACSAEGKSPFLLFFAALPMALLPFRTQFPIETLQVIIAVCMILSLGQLGSMAETPSAKDMKYAEQGGDYNA